MKILCCLLLFFIPLLSHAGNLSCDGSLRWLSLSGVDALRDSGDQTPAFGCGWQSRITPQKRRLLPALPSFYYRRALPTDMSRSEGFIRYEFWQVSLPLLRISDMYLSFDASSDYRQQMHTLDSALQWQNTSLSSGTELLVDSREHNYRLTLDLQSSETPVSYLWLNYRRQQQPLSVSRKTAINQSTANPTETDLLIEAEITSKALGIAFAPSGYGIRPNISLLLGQGEAREDGQGGDIADAVAGELKDSSDQLSFLLLETQTGLRGRYRLGQHLILQASGGINWRYFLYPDEDSEKTIRKASYSAVDYSISSGLSWRF